MQDELDPGVDTTQDSGPAVETMPSMEEMLKAAELTAAEHHDAWLRIEGDSFCKGCMDWPTSEYLHSLFGTDLVLLCDSGSVPVKVCAQHRQSGDRAPLRNS